MKTIAKISVTGAFVLLSTLTYSQSDSLGLPGDNLNLRAVLSIFKQATSVEDFEKRLNSADSKVNNLDLNGDNQVDYLRVVDYGKDNFHTIVIQDPVSKTESQDVAVIQIVKKDENTASVQIVGDETLYGKNYIIEPTDQAPPQAVSGNKNSDAVNDDVYAGENTTANRSSDVRDDRDDDSRVVVNVWGWPAVNYIYSPGYSYWVSPWYWGYYPGWYSPWRPWGWYNYHNFYVGYNYGFYGWRRYHYAYPQVHNYYYGRRVSSGYVQKTAPRYGQRRDGYHRDGGQRVQPRGSGQRNQGASNPSGRTNQRNVGNNSGGRSTNGAVRTGSQQKQNSSPRVNSSPSRQSDGGRINNQGSGGRVNQGGRTTPGSGRVNQGGGSGGGRMSSPGGGGGGRSGGGGGGGGRSSGGGGANRR